MTIKLSDTQLVLLSAAAQRDDRCLIAPKNLKGGAARKVAAKLVGIGLVREIKAKAGAPPWRRDEAGDGVALKLTAAGLKAIAVDEDVGDAAGKGEASDRAEPIDAANAGKQAVASSAGAPRGGTKLAAVIGLLQRPDGATIDQLTAVTGWLAHTTRAAITGLRKRNYAVSLDRSDKARGSVYRIAESREQPTATASAARSGRRGRVGTDAEQAA